MGYCRVLGVIFPQIPVHLGVRGSKTKACLSNRIISPTKSLIDQSRLCSRPKILPVATFMFYIKFFFVVNLNVKIVWAVDYDSSSLESAVNYRFGKCGKIRRSKKKKISYKRELNVSRAEVVISLKVAGLIGTHGCELFWLLPNKEQHDWKLTYLKVAPKSNNIQANKNGRGTQDMNVKCGWRRMWFIPAYYLN